MVTNICCVLRTGGDYDFEYVEKLLQGVRNNLQNFNFFCLSDIEINIERVERIALKYKWPGWWSKMEIFRPDLPMEDLLYIDLDTIILGDLSDIVHANKITLLRDFFWKKEYGSGLMFWPKQERSRIWRKWMLQPAIWMARGKTKENWGDQGFIKSYLPYKPDTWQDLVSDQVVSYKVHCMRNNGKDRIAPANARVVCFHGKPRPREIGWEIKQESGEKKRVFFDEEKPQRQKVAKKILDRKKPLETWEEKTVYLIAGGASAKGFNFEYLRVNRKKNKDIVIAINDSIRGCWFADYVFTADCVWLRYRRKILRQLKHGTKIVVAAPEKWKARPFGIKFEEVKRIEESIIEVGSNTAITGNSGYSALTYAVIRGAKRIALIGYDMHQDRREHWYKDYEWHCRFGASHYGEWAQQMDAFAAEVSKLNCKVVNLNANSAVSAYPFFTIEDCVKGAAWA